VVESEFAKYEHFLGTELPLRVRQQLETRIEAALNLKEEFQTLRSQIIEIVRDTQLELFKLYRTGSSNQPTGSNSAPGPGRHGSSSEVQYLRGSNSNKPSNDNLEIVDSQLHVTSCGKDFDTDFDFASFDGVMFDLTDIISTDGMSAVGVYDWNNPMFT